MGNRYNMSIVLAAEVQRIFLWIFDLACIGSFGGMSVEREQKEKKGVLHRVDSAAAEKGSAVVTAWQFVKFIVVSLLACIVQFALLNILQLLPPIQELFAKDFRWWVFDYPAAANGLGYFIAFNVSNIVAQIVAFFVNRKKTFNADNNIPVTLTIYIIATVLLICFSAWLSPTINAWLIGLNVNDKLAGNISTMVCSTLQFFIYFPIDKLLMRQKKQK